MSVVNENYYSVNNSLISLRNATVIRRPFHMNSYDLWIVQTCRIIIKKWAWTHTPSLGQKHQTNERHVNEVIQRKLVMNCHEIVLAKLSLTLKVKLLSGNVLDTSAELKKTENESLSSHLSDKTTCVLMPITADISKINTLSFIYWHGTII